MELRHLRYFVAVAEELHFGRAAARLGIVQSALSQQIQQLERGLGVALLARTKRVVALTPPGRLFLPEARQTLAQADGAAEVARRAAAGAVGWLRVGYVGAALWSPFPDAVRRFRRRHPGVAVKLVDGQPARHRAALLAGRLDVAVGPPPPADSGLATMVFHESALAVAVPEGDPLAALDAVRLEQLADARWVMIPQSARSPYWAYVVRVCASAGFTPRVAEEASALDSVVALVGTGAGVALVPAAAGDAPARGAVIRPLADVDLRVSLAATWHAGQASPTAANFLTTLRELGNARCDERDRGRRE
jgi:LysR family transcriptional regulator, benzoate and cis,cis-muconate-responsive activator of ben and cat genes